MARTLPIRLRTIAAAIVVIASGLIIWNAYQSIIGSSDVTDATLPIIKADAEPFRVEPEDRGGAEIPNQGNQLFDVLNADNDDDLALDGVNIEGEKEPETIFETPPSTEGFALPELPDSQTESLFDDVATVESDRIKPEDDVVEPIAEDDKQELQNKLKAAIEKVEEDTDSSLRRRPQSTANTSEIDEMDSGLRQNDGSKNDDGNIVIPTKKPSYTRPSPVEVTVITSEPSPSPRPVARAPVQKRYYIQLASLRGESAAREAYNTIRADYPSLVEGLNVSFPQADLGARGTFTRIQIGPLESESQARNRCANYNAISGATCLVLSR